MNRDSYIFYRNWWEAFRSLPDELRLQIYDYIMQYAFERNVDGIPVVVMGFVKMAMPFIDRDFEKYEAMCKRNKANGLKGGRPKTQDNPQKPTGFSGFFNKTQNNPQKPDNDNYNDNDNENNNTITLKGYEKFNFAFVEEVFRDAFFKWLEYKRSRGEKYKSQTSIESAYKHLKELCDNDPKIANLIIEQSLANNWAGLFEIKKIGYGNSSNGSQREIHSEGQKALTSLFTEEWEENK